MIDRVKEVDSPDGLLLDGAWLSEPVEGTDTGRKVVARREGRPRAAVAAEHDLTQVNQAVDGLLDGGENPRRRPLPMFHLAMVLEEGDVVDCRLDAEHAAVLVVHLDRGTGEAVFDAGPLDASGKLRTDLLGQLRADLRAEKAGDSENPAQPIMVALAEAGISVMQGFGRAMQARQTASSSSGGAQKRTAWLRRR